MTNPLFTVGATVFTEGGQERKIAKFAAEAIAYASQKIIVAEIHRLEWIAIHTKTDPDTANAEAERIVKANAERKQA